MLYYFELRFKILNRKLIDFGTPLLIGYPLIVIAFIVASNYLFDTIEYAELIYISMAFSFTLKLNSIKRNQFLKNTFNKKKYTKLRIIENFIYTLPFVLFLIYKSLLVYSLILVALVFVAALISFNLSLNFTIPTPFGKKPFEFLVGFRKTFLIFPIVYFLCFKSISVSNLNLGLFTIILIALICSSYYNKPENEYYIWSFNLSPKEFLIEKIKTCFIYFSIICFPIILILCWFFFIDLLLIISIYIFCIIFLISIIFAKYSVYPNEISLPEGILVVICFIFPPIIIGVFPYLYSKSIKNLNPFLK